MVKKLFSDWKSGSIPEYTMPKVNNVETTEIDFINMPMLYNLKLQLLIV